MRTGPAASTQAIPSYTTSRDTIQLQNENHRQGLFDHLRNLVTLVALEIAPLVTLIAVIGLMTGGIRILKNRGNFLQTEGA